MRRLPLRSATTALRAETTSIPRYFSGHVFVERPVLVDDRDDLEVVTLPDLVVVGVVPGVIFTAPVPNSRSTYASAMMGIAGPTAAGARSCRRARCSARRPGARRPRCRRASSRAGWWRPPPSPTRPRAGSDVREPTLHLFVLDLVVAERGLGADRPVHHVEAAIDEPLLVERHEDLAHRLTEPLVHREPLTRPVAARPDLLQLLRDDGGGSPSPPRFAR